MSRDFTDDEIIFAYQQIGLGRDAADVFVEITGNDECRLVMVWDVARELGVEVDA